MRFIPSVNANKFAECLPFICNLLNLYKGQLKNFKLFKQIETAIKKNHIQYSHLNNTASG